MWSKQKAKKKKLSLLTTQKELAKRRSQQVKSVGLLRDCLKEELHCVWRLVVRAASSQQLTL